MYKRLLKIKVIIKRTNIIFKTIILQNNIKQKLSIDKFIRNCIKFKIYKLKNYIIITN